MKLFILPLLSLVCIWGFAQVLLVDQAGREVRVPFCPQRVASDFGVATPYLYSLISGERILLARYLGDLNSPIFRMLMARIDPAYPTKALKAESGVEEFVAKDADLVFTSLARRDLADLLTIVGIPVILIGPETFETVKETISLVGQALGEEERAQRLLLFYQEVLDRIAISIRGIPIEAQPKVLVLGTSPLRVASGAMYQTQMVKLAGGIPVTLGLVGSWQNVNIEQILLWNPDIILIVSYSPIEPGLFSRDSQWTSVEAVRSGRVYKMPQLLFAWDTPIPESILGILWMAKLFHPGRVQQDFLEIIQTFYREFYRCELSSEELATLLGK